MNEIFMKKAIEIAQNSGKDIPIGAVIVKNNEIIAYCCNEKEKDNDVTAHAEIQAIRKASKILNNWRLNGCDIYVTLEPCPMCMWAICCARIENLYFGAYDNLYGAISTTPQLIELSKSKINIKGGIMENECNKLLSRYFEKLR
jgi:tRNA(adenine34) deaminase